MFHQFYMNYEEYGNSTGNLSTATIERKDGTVENVPA